MRSLIVKRGLVHEHVGPRPNAQHVAAVTRVPEQHQLPETQQIEDDVKPSKPRGSGDALATRKDLVLSNGAKR